VGATGINQSTINKNTEILVDARKEVCLDENTEETKYMLLSRHQNAGQNCYIKIANRSFEHVAQFRYLGTTITNQNLIRGKINRRLNFCNASYQSIQKLLFSRLLSKNIKIRIYKTIILTMVLYECEILSLTLREKYRLRVFENRVFRRMLGLKGTEVTGGYRKLHNKEFHNLYSSPNVIRMIKEDEMGRACSTNGREEECI
jgi:hypothetical protein